jgi:hypothetical protein
MGYSLTIGEAELKNIGNEIKIIARKEKHSNAPAFGEPTDFTNERWPSYSSWESFTNEMELGELMTGDEPIKWEGEEYYPLICEHPGITVITRYHFAMIKRKIKAYKEKYPDHIAQYPPAKEGIEKAPFYRSEDYVDDPIYDGNLCRAEWLIYWIGWALQNCENPIFVNT